MFNLFDYLFSVCTPDKSKGYVYSATYCDPGALYWGLTH